MARANDRRGAFFCEVSKAHTKRNPFGSAICCWLTNSAMLSRVGSLSSDPSASPSHFCKAGFQNTANGSTMASNSSSPGGHDGNTQCATNHGEGGAIEKRAGGRRCGGSEGREPSPRCGASLPPLDTSTRRDRTTLPSRRPVDAEGAGRGGGGGWGGGAVALGGRGSSSSSSGDGSVSGVGGRGRIVGGRRWRGWRARRRTWTGRIGRQ